jgi:hypothetical protein
VTAGTADSGGDAVRFDDLWAQLLEALQRAPALIFKDDVPGDAQMRAEGYRYLSRLLRAGIGLCIEYGDPDYPAFGRLNAPTLQFGADCPNYMYDHASLRPGNNYRVWGRRGTVRFIDIDVVDGDFSHGTSFQPVGRLTSQDLEFEGDAYEIFIGPDPHPQNWIPTGDAVNHVLVRRVLGDWTDDTGELGIERIGALHPGRSFEPQAMAARFQRLVDWMSIGTAEWDRVTRMTSLDHPSNMLNFPPADSRAPFSPNGGFLGQWYGFGNWNIAQDEVLVIEFAPPTDAISWAIGLSSWYWEGLDYCRATSINDAQATLDADDTFRAVVAHHDPGVPNWLDTTGHRRGVLWARSLYSTVPPVPQCRVMAENELRAYLPASTPHVTPYERSETLRRRDQAVWRRGG